MRRAIFLGLALTFLVIAASSRQIHGWLVALLPTAETIIRDRPVVGVTVFILFAAASAMLAFVSSAVIVPVGVYVWGTGISIVLLLVGWVLGGVCAYAIGRYLGRPAVQALTPMPVLDRYADRFSRTAPFSLVLLLQAAMPSEVPGYLLGLARYDFRKYLVALTLTELPYSAATVYIGEGFIERRIWVLIGVGAVLVVFSGWMLHLLQRQFRVHRV